MSRRFFGDGREGDSRGRKRLRDTIGLLHIWEGEPFCSSHLQLQAQGKSQSQELAKSPKNAKKSGISLRQKCRPRRTNTRTESVLKKLKSFWWITWHQGLGQAVKKTREQLGMNGPGMLKEMMFREKFPQPIKSNATAYLSLLKVTPKISIVIPVYNSTWLKSTVPSVLNQSYQNFELILVDDCSTLAETKEELQRLKTHEKVKVLESPKNLNISGATNIGLKQAEGEWIVFMDHDDLLHPDALAYFVRMLNDMPNHDVYYSDEAIIDTQDRILGVMKKCPVTMDILLSVNLITHLCIIRKDSLFQIGLLHSEYDGAQDHDLMIRAMEHGLRFCYMPFCLYGWRSHESSTSADVRSYQGGQKELPKSYKNGKKAIAAYLERQRISADVTDDAYPWYRVKYQVPSEERVSIIVPFKDQVHFLKSLCESLPKTEYKNFELVLVNNRSTKPETEEYLRTLRSEQRYPIRFVDFDEPFNYSRLYNKVVKNTAEEFLLFLNNDVEVIDPTWLRALLEHIHRQDVAAVGCKLIRKDGSIQHAGMIFRPNVHFCAMNVPYEDGYYTNVQRDVSGVTAACMLIRKSAFEKIGGFDEVNFPIGFSDADLCLRLIRAGYKIVYTPYAKLYHHESASRAVQEESYEKYALFRHHIGDSPLVDQRYKVE